MSAATAAAKPIADNRPKGGTVHERKLVARAQGGDRDAIEELYIRHFDDVFTFVFSRVGNRHDAEDVTTQTFLKMVESIHSFRWRSVPFLAWLKQIAFHLSVDHFRQTRRWLSYAEVPICGVGASAEDQAIASIGTQNVVVLAQSLKPEHRRVLALKFLLSCSNAQAASQLDKSQGAVKALQHRALEALHRKVVQASSAA
ncbi:MAG: sigma-70 family RNA polymerase sigma factor [Actinomycetota bacterium]|nr:sigma-70 family RNA polymerase sigma factor [Actinomycetota bacterium]